MTNHHFTRSFMAKVRREKVRLESEKPKSVDPVERAQNKLGKARERGEQPPRSIDTPSDTQ